MSVNRPAQIEPALQLLEEALERAPSQNGPMLQRSSGQYWTSKPYFTVDAEFWEVDRNGKLREPNGKTSSSQREGSTLRRSGRLEKLRENLGLNSQEEKGEAESEPELKPWSGEELGPSELVDPRTLPAHVAEKENLCTVLTIAVDRHLVFSFFILDMLQKADSDPTTVPKVGLESIDEEAVIDYVSSPNFSSAQYSIGGIQRYGSTINRIYESLMPP